MPVATSVVQDELYTVVENLVGSPRSFEQVAPLSGMI